MKNRTLFLSILVVSIVSFCPFSLDAKSSSSNVDEVKRISMIEELGGSIYLITKCTEASECSTIGPVDLAYILEHLTYFRPETCYGDGYSFSLNGYVDIKRLQDIRLRNGHFIRTNFYQEVYAELYEDQLVYIIADKELVILPKLDTVMGVVGEATYRLENVRELEASDKFLVLTLSKLPAGAKINLSATAKLPLSKLLAKFL